MFDGDLDPDWVESLNSVLDDNKTLTLPNGERIELLPNVRVIFEVRDIGHGTPATVSRCGMVWFAENTVLVDDLLQRYISKFRLFPMNCVTSEVWSAQTSLLQPISDMQLRVHAILEPYFASDGFLSSSVKLSLKYHHIMPVGAMQLCSNVISLLTRFLDDVCFHLCTCHPTLMLHCRLLEHFRRLLPSLKMRFSVLFAWHVGGDFLRPCLNQIATIFPLLALNFACCRCHPLLCSTCLCHP